MNQMIIFKLFIDAYNNIFLRNQHFWCMCTKYVYNFDAWFSCNNL